MPRPTELLAGLTEPMSNFECQDSGTDTSEGQMVVNEVKGSDQEKCREVEAMERLYNKEFPLLKHRFQTGAVTENPLEMMGLVQETAEFMLLPVRKCMGHSTIVILGIAGSGKSTFSNWLLGHELKKVQDSEAEDDDAISINIREPSFVVGHGNSSQTFAPNVKEMNDGTFVVDFPGFMDTNGVEIRIGMDLAFRRMIEWLKPAHVLALVPIDGFEAGRGTLLRQQISKLTRLLPTRGAPLANGVTASPEEACMWMVGVTKCDRDFIKGPIRKFKEAVKMLQDIDAALDAETVVNINEWMFEPKVENPRQRLKELIFDKTKTPTVPNAKLTEAMDKCFPSSESAEAWKEPNDPYPSCLVSDCLSPVEMEWFQKALSTAAFCDVFLREDEQRAKEHDAAGDDGWKKMRTVFKEYTQRIKSDSDTLAKLCLLSTERREPRVQELCLHRQCRLKACFVKVEEKIMAKNMEHIQEVQQTYIKQYLRLKKEVPIKPEDCEKVDQKIKEVDESFLADVQDMGHDDLPTFLRDVSMLGALISVGLRSSAGLAGSILLLTATQAMDYLEGCSTERSRETASMLMDAMADLAVAHRAVAAHTKKLAAIRTSLDNLQVNPKD